jgi:hypothetical protein
MEQHLSKALSGGIPLAQRRGSRPRGIREARRFQPGALLDSTFLEMYANGEPFVVEGAMDSITPQQFMDMDNAKKLKVEVLTEETGDTESMTWAQYFKRWTTTKANKETLKVKVRHSNHFGFHD